MQNEALPVFWRAGTYKTEYGTEWKVRTEVLGILRIRKETEVGGGQLQAGKKPGKVSFQ